MKITRHTGPDIRHALRAVRDSLGADAVILATRRTANGVEITAAMDFDADNVQDSTAPASTPSFIARQILPKKPVVPDAVMPAVQALTPPPPIPSILAPAPVLAVAPEPVPVVAPGATHPDPRRGAAGTARRRFNIEFHFQSGSRRLGRSGRHGNAGGHLRGSDPGPPKRGDDFGTEDPAAHA